MGMEQLDTTETVEHEVKTQPRDVRISRITETNGLEEGDVPVLIECNKEVTIDGKVGVRTGRVPQALVNQHWPTLAPLVQGMFANADFS